jgi:ketosteroid isomerase-like protein
MKCRRAIVVATVAVAVCGADARQLAGLPALVAREQAFARAALEKGIRDAFVEFLAEDSVGFYPTPMNARDFYRRQAPTPLTQRLEWEPRLGDLADAGDLGWLTGPYMARDVAAATPPRYGCYFSIWKKQGDGQWAVLIDVGAPSPAPVTFDHDGFAAVEEPDGRYRGAESPSAALALLRLDGDVSGPVGSIGSAYARVLTAVSRVHVPGREPFVGPTAIDALLQQDARPLRVATEASELARSGELGFTRGRYDLLSREGAPSETGYYVRMWKRTSRGQWTLAVEVRSPLPGAK